jgi:peroxiredoxin
VEKIYWLKASDFSGRSIDDILKTKGVVFPAGSSTTWRPPAGEFAVVNTAANHEKIAAVLAAESGGVVLSPTHWLLLTSGARLGLVVEKFSPDAVTGSHPVFGRCRIPLDQIHTVRTTPPEATPAMKSLADWRLVNAPEPVLPESGGESSPTLGKVAKTFSLPLLGGGNFDLEKWKGKVVVLDFWATWCGPCIKSLPALIETMAAFPAERVTLLGVNQSEPAELVKRFLETRGWKFTVALDAGQKVARQYGVEGIPHTVIVGPDGNVAWVKTGFSPDGAAEAAAAVKQLLAEPAAAPK